MLDLLVAAAALVGPVGEGARRACSYIVRPWLRMDSVAYVVVVAAGDTVPAATWTPPVYRRPSAGSGAIGEARPTSRRVYGQSARVERVGGRVRVAAAPDDSAGPVITAGSDVALVAWDEDRRGMCGAAAPPWSARFWGPGSRVFLPGMPRPDSTAGRLLPVYDVRPAHHTFFPFYYSPDQLRAELPRRWYHLGRAPRVLTIEEYEGLYRAMPGWGAWESAPERAAQSLGAWARANRRLARRSPAREALAAMERELAWRRTDPEQR